MDDRPKRCKTCAFTLKNVSVWTGQSEAAREKHKENILRENPEVLFTDCTQHKEGRRKNNLIFFIFLLLLAPSTSGKILQHNICITIMHMYPVRALAQEAE